MYVATEKLTSLAQRQHELSLDILRSWGKDTFVVDELSSATAGWPAGAGLVESSRAFMDCWMYDMTPLQESSERASLYITEFARAISDVEHSLD